MARIGVFWFYQGAVLGIAEEWEEGEEWVKGLFDSKLEHAQVWEHPGFLGKYQTLKHSEYSTLPRGRVLFSVTENLSIVYLDQCLSRQKQKAAIMRFFDIPSGKVRWRKDLHYTTSRAALDQLWDCSRG